MMKILGHINLENFPTKKPAFNFEKYQDLLSNRLSFLADKVNNEFGPIVDSGGSVKFSDGHDLNLIKIQEETWAKEQSLSREDWLRKKEKNKGEMTEKAITLLLDEILGEDFLVVRASSFDDYNNGVDNVILDKRTGNVVCGFDDVISRDKDDGSEKKDEKIKRIMSRGGAKLKYGLNFKEGGGLETKELKNLPAFYLALSKDDLALALESLEKGRPDEGVDKLAIKLFNSIDKQIKDIDREKLDNNLLFNINEFENSFFSIKKDFLKSEDKGI